MSIWCQKVTTFANVLRNYVFIAWFKAFYRLSSQGKVRKVVKETWAYFTFPAMDYFTGPKLLDFKNSPPHLQFNKYVLTGYRPISTYRDCLRSLFYLHNEFGNIYTHGMKNILHNLHCNSWNLFNILSAVKQGSCNWIMWM